MTTPQEKEQIKKYFTEKIATFKKVREIYENSLFGGLKNHTQTPEQWSTAASQRPESAIAYVTYVNFIETFEMLENLTDGILESEDRIVKLEKDMNKIAKETNVDLTEMKTQVAKIKEAVEEPIYKYVKTQQDTEEKRRKLEAELLDWAIRSH